METFVVRIWMPADGTAELNGGELHGVVERITTGDETAFRGTSELLAFMRKAIVVEEKRQGS